MPAEFFTSSNPASLKLANRKYTGTGFITADDMKKNDMGKFGMYSYLLFVHPLTLNRSLPDRDHSSLADFRVPINMSR